MNPVNPSDFLEQFDAEGYVILKGLLEPQVVEGARQAMNQLVERCATRLLSEGRVADRCEDEPFETRLWKLYENNLDLAPRSFRPELHLAGLFPLFFSPRLLDAVDLLLGPEIRLYPNYTARPKLPEWEGTLILWHQDGGYTHKHLAATTNNVEALRMVNVWSPLVPARVENGCMQFVPGTHKLGVVPHVEKTLYLEIAEEYLAPRLNEALDIETDPGDAVLFHNLLFHCGQPNRSQSIRWSLDWRYQDATQPTLRKEHGHLARSRLHPEAIVQSAEEWANLSFG